MQIPKNQAAEDLPRGQILANLGIKDRLVLVGRGAVGALIGNLWER